jgi:hypothetical protein
MRIPPEDYKTNVGQLCSNFDHVIDREVAIKLTEGKFLADYCAWDWFGYVWFESSKYYCKVMRYNSHIGTVEADTVEDLKSELCSTYGDE